MMHAQEILVLRGLWGREIVRLCESIGQKPVTNEPVFSRRKDVRAEIQVVTVVIDKLERQHFVRALLLPARREQWNENDGCST